MGGCDFYVERDGKTPREAFLAACEDARYEYGHGGYTGTIAEKREFKVISPETALAACKRVRASDGTQPGTDDLGSPSKLIACICEHELLGYANKWGPALCMQIGPTRYAFFGVASD